MWITSWVESKIYFLNNIITKTRVFAQAKRMKIIKLPLGIVGDTVKLSVLDPDGDRTNLRYIGRNVFI